MGCPGYWRRLPYVHWGIDFLARGTERSWVKVSLGRNVWVGMSLGLNRGWTKHQVSALVYMEYKVFSREYLSQIYTVYKTNFVPKLLRTTTISYKLCSEFRTRNSANLLHFSANPTAQNVIHEDDVRSFFGEKYTIPTPVLSTYLMRGLSDWDTALDLRRRASKTAPSSFQLRTRVARWAAISAVHRRRCRANLLLCRKKTHF